MKRLCKKNSIPTAKAIIQLSSHGAFSVSCTQYASFTDAVLAKEYIRSEGAPIVVKADGLAAGKGVVVASTVDEACAAADTMLVNGAYGSAVGRILVEEFLEGEEVSFFAIVDGENAGGAPSQSMNYTYTSKPLLSDHKRAGEGDTGPNTGGMGAYSPALLLTPALEAHIMDRIIVPTVAGMATEGLPFVIMLRLQTDLAEVLLAATQRGGLAGLAPLQWADGAALVVVLAALGYPGAYERGTPIRDVAAAQAAAPGVKIFHAGTAVDADGRLVAAGGRVLGVAALGPSLFDAQTRAYAAVDAIDWPGGFCRRDIGWQAVGSAAIARTCSDRR
eukprot:SM001845S03858  [mRNA]  locus=s1845:482:1924:- [translate_table: standard]